MTQGHNTARRSAHETKSTSVINVEVGKKLWHSTQVGNNNSPAASAACVRACVCVCLCVRAAESAVRGRAGVYRGGGGVAQAGSIGVGVQERQGAVFTAFFTDHSSSRDEEWTKYARRRRRAQNMRIPPHSSRLSVFTAHPVSLSLRAALRISALSSIKGLTRIPV